MNDLMEELLFKNCEGEMRIENLNGVTEELLLKNQNERNENMNAAMDELIKKPCTFIIRMEEPLLTSSRILVIFFERWVKVSTMNLHMMDGRDGFLIIHCLMEKDRMRSMMHLLEKFKGVAGLEVLQGRNSNLLKEIES